MDGLNAIYNLFFVPGLQEEREQSKPVLQELFSSLVMREQHALQNTKQAPSPTWITTWS